MNPDDLVLLTGRSHQRVTDAAREVAALPETRTRVEDRVLDVTDTDAIARIADDLRAWDGGVDVVISNAVVRMLPEESQAERADEFIDVSNTATHAILRSFGPGLRPGCRLLVVASSLGTLGHLDRRLHHLFGGAQQRLCRRRDDATRGQRCHRTGHPGRRSLPARRGSTHPREGAARLPLLR